MTTSSQTSIRPQFRTIGGLPIRFAESERDEARGGDALLLSPWPESVHAFQPTWSQLAEHAHLVAIDLPGFGDSERRDALMTPRAIGDLVVRAADAFGLEHPHVVGLDTGTSAALFAAALHPERLRSLVIGSGGAAVPLQIGGILHEWVEAPDLHLYLHGDSRELVATAIGTIDQPTTPPGAAGEDHLTAYAAECFADSMRYVRDCSAELLVLRDLLSEIRTPALIVAGRRDADVPLSSAEFLRERLPKSKLAVVDAGRFTWKDAADEFSALVTLWWDEGYAVARAAAGG